MVPSLQVPAFDGIGANEYIVDVTHDGAVHFISAVDTPYPWELSIWYHTLNVGFRTRISGETDFPCITDDRVGRGRTYARLPGLSYAGLLDAVRRGATYVSDGRAHLLDFAVNGTPVGSGDGTVPLRAGEPATVTVTGEADLDDEPHHAPNASGTSGSGPSVSDVRWEPPLSSRPLDEQPYWDVERARIAGTRRVPVELIVNGKVAGRQEIEADRQPHDLRFSVTLDRSAWIAVRILPAAHTNPVFAIVDGQPIRASRASARWCLAGVDQSWTQKAPQIRPTELDAARAAWDHARAVYRQRLAESPVE